MMAKTSNRAPLVSIFLLLFLLMFSQLVINAKADVPSVVVSGVNVLDAGQTILLTANPSGGSGDYSFQWYNDTAGANAPIINTNSVTYSAISGAAGTFDYYVLVTDSNVMEARSTPDTAVTVNPLLSATAQPDASTNLGIGENVLVSALGQGGAGSYTYSWSVTPSTSCPGFAPVSTNSFTYTPTSITTDCMFTATVADGLASNTITTAQIVFDPVSISASPTTVDDGQTSVITVLWSSGKPLYTVMLYSSLTSDCSSSSTFITQYRTNGHYMQFVEYSQLPSTYYCASVTDSTMQTAISSHVQVSVNPTLSANDIVPMSPIIDSGQTVILTANAVGGTPGYTYNWYTGAGCTSPISGATSITYSASSTSNAIYYYQVTDSASSSETACSTGDSVTVNPSLLSTGLTANTNPIIIGQPQALIANVSGGTPPYAYNFLVYNSSGQVANLLLTNSGLATNSFMYTQNSDWGIGTFTANLFITDSAATQITVSNTLTYIATSTTSTSTSTSTTTTISTTNPSDGGTTPPFSSGNVTSVVEYTVPGTNNTGHEILNFTEQHSISFSINGKQFTVVLNSIGPSRVDITVNGKSYSIASGQTKLLSDPPDYSYYASLISISYLPVLHSVNLALYGVPLQQTTTTTRSTTVTTIEPEPTITFPAKIKPEPPIHAAPEESNRSASSVVPSTLVSLGGVGVAVAVAVAAGVAYSRMRRTANENKYYR